MKGRNWTAEEKLAIVLEGIKGTKPVAEICRAPQMAQTQSDQWRDRVLEGGKRALTTGISNTEEALKREVETRQRLIGKQAVAMEVLKKPTTWSGGGDPGGCAARGGVAGGGSLSAGRAVPQRLRGRSARAPGAGDRAGSLR